jgi:hypothetical protein
MFCNISLKSSQNEKYFGQNCRENQNTYFMFNCFPKSCPLWNDVEKMIQPDRPQMTKGGHVQTKNSFVFVQHRTLYMNTHYGLLLTVTYICHKSIVVQHPVFLYSRQWRVAQKHTEAVVASPLQRWLCERTTVLRLCTLPILLYWQSMRFALNIDKYLLMPLFYYCLINCLLEVFAVVRC